MANRDLRVEMKDSNGVGLKGVAKTATFTSQGYSVNGLEYFGILIDQGAIAGTTPTMNVSVDFSLDGGTTWIAKYPAAENSQTQAALAEVVSTVVDSFKCWINLLPNDNNAQVRFNFVLAGTSESYTFTNVYFIARRWGKY